MNGTVTIIWTKEMFTRFKMAYEGAKGLEMPVFNFDGNEYVLSYAKYLVEFLDGKFKTKK